MIELGTRNISGIISDTAEPARIDYGVNTAAYRALPGLNASSIAAGLVGCDDE